ncbi:NAD(P)H-binding protein [Jatrophihabitans sp.]|uniref:NAD(P)H-binding protein n=1 Tax=Jatrophihabitans sp. TaxID=1932789 RepID=UPI0030C738C9|nr:NAD-dependent epimerase/dehydratase [Jatrophihabitans sp.]
MGLDVLVTGATGFIGARLAVALDEAGHDVRAMTRRPESYEGPGTAVFGDVGDPASLEQALTGIDAAYYLVHSLEHGDFEERDAAAARAFGKAAAQCGVRQIVYLGGLGSETQALSPHLRSRRAVEGLLGDGGVPVTVLRAAVVIGHGGISWEITRQLVDHLPAMIAPKWVRTRTQPIALPDVIRYLVGVLDNPEAIGRVFEVGGPDVLRYTDMMKRVAVIQNKRLLPVFTVPLLTPRLSSRWLQFITDVDLQTARTLIDSMSTEVVVTDASIYDVVPGPTLSYDEAVTLALAERSERSERSE